MKTKITILLLFCMCMLFCNCSNENQQQSLKNQKAISVPLLERYMYIDRTDTIYKNNTSTAKLGAYLKKYKFSGVYLYSTSGILSSNANYLSFGNFLKTLTNNGIIYKTIAIGNSNMTNLNNFNNSQSDLLKKVNRVNLELEWWNNTSTWANWNTINTQIASGPIIDNDFYEGWYKNLGTTKDTIASKLQVANSDRILLHCYQLGIPTYSYANAPSTTGGIGRLDIIAKGAKQMNKKIDLFIILSAERKTWGAANDFSGLVLQNAYLSGQSNPYAFIENQAYSNIFNNMTLFQKTWINFKGFVWFTKRFCQKAVSN